MNPTAAQRRISDYDDASGPCTCETYGWCALCVALRAYDTFTVNAAASGLRSAYIQDDVDEERPPSQPYQFLPPLTDDG